MKTLLFLASALLLQLVTSSPVAPASDVTGGRPARQHHATIQLVRVKGYATPPSPTPPALDLRKGEYDCDGRVCQLKPGQVPAGCNGICQYRLS